MSNNKWRFDPNTDYRNYEEDDYSNSKGGGKYTPMKKGNHFHSDKFDGKRMKRKHHNRNNNNDNW